ncbi:MAG: PhoH family protein [Mariprofundaceae bacterium]|nr:PhoH family protein [Mariprofundaceae bacterium]
MVEFQAKEYALIAPDERKIYVLDTNVLIHDPHSLSRFDEHDVVLPVVVLEEMDKVKRGFDELARNVREVSRYLDEISNVANMEEGCPLPGGGRLFFHISHDVGDLLPESFARNYGDNRILAVTMSLQKEHPGRDVILVSKDINLRIKARAVGLVSEDYRSDRVVDDLDVLSGGQVRVDDEAWGAMAQDMKVEGLEHGNRYTVTWPGEMQLPYLNSFILPPGDRELAYRCMEVDGESRVVKMDDSYSYRSERHAVWGVQARNLEQDMAMNLLMDPEIDIVTLLGLAGSGKTLLALACGLHQTLDVGGYDKILVTRATVPMGQDIGFLPGTEREKMEPWMGAITDNLSFLLGEEAQDLASILGEHRIEIASLSFARGRTFTKTWLIVDEAQNLTPHQMKTIVTRMGEGSKIIILGNNAQIDTPYLTSHSNGLSLVAMQFAGWAHSGQIMLKESERSRLAAYAAEVL